jgi:hypothetical protein
LIFDYLPRFVKESLIDPLLPVMAVQLSHLVFVSYNRPVDIQRAYQFEYIVTLLFRYEIQAAAPDDFLALDIKKSAELFIDECYYAVFGQKAAYHDRKVFDNPAVSVFAFFELAARGDLLFLVKEEFADDNRGERKYDDHGYCNRAKHLEANCGRKGNGAGKHADMHDDAEQVEESRLHYVRLALSDIKKAIPQTAENVVTETPMSAPARPDEDGRPP